MPEVTCNQSSDTVESDTPTSPENEVDGLVLGCDPNGPREDRKTLEQIRGNCLPHKEDACHDREHLEARPATLASRLVVLVHRH